MGNVNVGPLLSEIFNELIQFETELKKSENEEDKTRIRYNATCDILLKVENYFTRQTSNI